jgi:hypothetical protein
MIECHAALQYNNQQCLSQRQPSHRRRHVNRQHDTVATTTATTTVATTNSHAAAYPNNLGVQKPRCSTAMLAGLLKATLFDSYACRFCSKPRCSTVRLNSHADRQLCSTVLLDSSTLAIFCYCAQIALLLRSHTL